MQTLLEFGIQNLRVNVESASTTIILPYFLMPIHCNLMDLIIKLTVSDVENCRETTGLNFLGQRGSYEC